MLDEIRTAANAIRDELSERLFHAAAAGKIPDLNTLVDEYWMLRLRRTIHAWRRDYPPPIVTHDLIDDQKDEVLNQLRACRLWNHQHDPVKVIYHADFVTPANPYFGMEYDQFVRGCHLGVFPSYYEPWGYTPLESIALGVPAITSDLSGFGAYLLKLLPEHEDKGIYVLRRRYASFDDAANQLADRMFTFALSSRRERVALRNNVESFSEHFDWYNLAKGYYEAHALALERLG
jgi:glycogen(starch) synthase